MDEVLSLPKVVRLRNEKPVLERNLESATCPIRVDLRRYAPGPGVSSLPPPRHGLGQHPKLWDWTAGDMALYERMTWSSVLRLMGAVLAVEERAREGDGIFWDTGWARRWGFEKRELQYVDQLICASGCQRKNIFKAKSSVECLIGNEAPIDNCVFCLRSSSGSNLVSSIYKTLLGEERSIHRSSVMLGLRVERDIKG